MKRIFRRRNWKVAALTIPRHMGVIVLMMWAVIGSAQTLDSTDWVFRIEKGHSIGVTPFMLLNLNNHYYVRANEGTFHHPDCPQYQCKARREAQYISDTTLIKNNGVSYRIKAPFEIHPIE